jgi:hypothetical protein
MNHKKLMIKKLKNSNKFPLKKDIKENYKALLKKKRKQLTKQNSLLKLLKKI